MFHETSRPKANAKAAKAAALPFAAWLAFRSMVLIDTHRGQTGMVPKTATDLS